jgi:hypothetical protein
LASLARKAAVAPAGFTPLGFSYLRACAILSEAHGSTAEPVLEDYLDWLEGYPFCGFPFRESMQFKAIKSCRVQRSR